VEHDPPLRTNTIHSDLVIYTDSSWNHYCRHLCRSLSQRLTPLIGGVGSSILAEPVPALDVRVRDNRVEVEIKVGELA
jgi:hypothetical protein